MFDTFGCKPPESTSGHLIRDPRQIQSILSGLKATKTKNDARSVANEIFAPDLDEEFVLPLGCDFIETLTSFPFAPDPGDWVHKLCLQFLALPVKSESLLQEMVSRRDQVMDFATGLRAFIYRWREPLKCFTWREQRRNAGPLGMGPLPGGAAYLPAGFYEDSMSCDFVMVWFLAPQAQFYSRSGAGGFVHNCRDVITQIFGAQAKGLKLTSPKGIYIMKVQLSSEHYKRLKQSQPSLWKRLFSSKSKQ